MPFYLNCDWCGKPIKKYRRNEHNFCSRQCLADFSNKRKNPDGYMGLKDYTNISAHMSELNESMNPTRMTSQVRKKIRNARLNTGAGVTYAKYYGKHEHRVIAEQVLGRPLLPKEIVHHRDGNKRNNIPENIVVFPSQSAHAEHHAELRWFISEIIKLEGGVAE
jgi:hypothetical protein